MATQLSLDDIESINLSGQLLQVVEVLKELLATSLKDNGRYASGRTIASLEAESTNTSATLSAPWWIYALQDGRKPTSNGAVAGNPTLFEAIKEWCTYKGIDVKYAYPIAKKIHEEGYAGIPGIIDEPLSDDNVDKALKGVLDDIANLFANVISNSIKTQ